MTDVDTVVISFTGNDIIVRDLLITGCCSAVLTTPTTLTMRMCPLMSNMENVEAGQTDFTVSV